MLLSARQKRAYSPTAPLYARDNLTFLGRPVARGAQVPEEYFSSKRHRLSLWRFRKVAHKPGGAFAAKATPAPAKVVEPVVVAPAMPAAPSLPAPASLIAKPKHARR